MVDITERKQVEEERARLFTELDRERQRLDSIVSSIPGVVWEAWGEPDASTQRIDYVSKYVEEMLGYTGEEWLQTPNFWLSIVHPDDRERAASEAAAIFASSRPGVSRFRWITKLGEALTVEAHSTAIWDEAGSPLGMRGVTMDISERARLQERTQALLEAERQARHDADEARRKIAFLADASEVLASSLDFETTLTTVARLAVPTIADWCAVDMLQGDETLKRLAVTHIDPKKVEWAYELYRRYPPDPDAPAGLYHVLRTGQHEFFPEVTDDMFVAAVEDPEQLRIALELHIRSVITLPLKAHERTLGVLTLVMAESERRYSQEDLAFAQDLARRAALAVDNALLYRAASQRQGDQSK
jgi:PAS domain S-box-containing protein